MRQPDKLGRRQSVKLTDDVIDEVLQGSIRYKEFEALHLSDISQDVRLGNCYNNSGVTSLQQFLDLGEARFNLRNYGRGSERKLRAGIASFLSANPCEAGSVDQTAPEFHAQLLLRKVLKSRTPWRALSEKEWAECRSRVKASAWRRAPIYSTAAQIGAYWPFSTKKKANATTVEQYLECTLEDLRSLRGFGQRKIGGYLACVIHLAQGGAVVVATSRPKTLRESIAFAWAHTNLAKREKLVIEHRFGIGMRKHTLTELAAMLSVTRERVRQIEKKAIFKLRLALDVKETAVLLAAEKLAIWECLSETPFLKRTVDLDLLEDRLPFEIHLAIELCVNRRHRGIKKAALGEWLGSSFPHDESNWYREKYLDRNISSLIQRNIHSGLSLILGTL